MAAMSTLAASRMSVSVLALNRTRPEAFPTNRLSSQNAHQELRS